MINDIDTITVLDPSCQKCSKLSTCNHKRMVHLGYIRPTRVSGNLEFQKQFYESMKGHFNYENRRT